MNIAVNEDLIKNVVLKNLYFLNSTVPIGVSNRHVHLSQYDLNQLFGPGYRLTPKKKVNQPGQFSCEEMVTLAGPKGLIERVRILGPVRKETQIEILRGDTFALGVKGVLRISGDLAGTPGITLIHGSNTVTVSHGVIIAKRHIHIDENLAKEMKLSNGQNVDVQVSGERSATLNNVEVRVSRNAYYEMHVDIEEANACGINGSSCGRIL